MEIGKWKLAQTWRHFKRPASSKGMWKQFVDDSKKSIQMAQGGPAQLVQPGPGRPGYSGKKQLADRTWGWYRSGDRGPSKYENLYADTEDALDKKIAAAKKKTKKISVEAMGEVSQKGLNLLRDNTNSWTTNWLDKNLKKFELRELDDALKVMKKDFAAEVKANPKKYTHPKLSFNPITENGFPKVSERTITQGSGAAKKNVANPKAFNYQDVGTLNAKGNYTKYSKPYFTRIFYNTYLNKNPEFKKKVTKYMNYILENKSGQVNQYNLKAFREFGEKIADKDVIHFLSVDSGLATTAKTDLMRKQFPELYETYQKKVNRAATRYGENLKIIENKLGLEQGSIRRSMRKEHEALAKIFDVSELPDSLRYSIDHQYGLAQAAASKDKRFIQSTLDNLRGMTTAMNEGLGWGGYNSQLKYFTKEIDAGRNVAKNLKDLNKLTKAAYNVEGAYQLSPKNKVLPAAHFVGESQPDRFASYFKQLSGTKEGVKALTKQVATNAQLSELMKKHKLLTGKPLPASLGGVSFMGVKSIDDFMTSGKYKGTRNLLKGEGYFILADYINNLSKGQSSQKALGKAIEVGSFGAIDLDADERALERYLRERGGYSETDITAMKDYLNYMKKYKNYERAYQMHEHAKEYLGQGTDDVMDVGTTWEDVTSARENLKLRENELRDLQATYEKGTTNMRLGKDTLTKAMHGLTAQEWNAPAGTFYDRGARTRQGEGAIWNLVGAGTRDIGRIATGQMPTELWDAVMPAQIDPFSKVEKQKLIMEHPVYGFEEEFKKPEFQEALEDIQYDMGYALAEGGIAGLLKK